MTQLRLNNSKEHSLCEDDLGFTLIEVMLALLILASSIVVLLGLQSSLMERTYQDNMREQAVLYGRRIFSALEEAVQNGEGVEEQTVEGTPEEVLNNFISVDPDSNAEKKGNDNIFSASLLVEPWALPGSINIDNGAFRRATLTISWGDSSRERTVLTFFIPAEAESEQDSDGNHLQ